MLIFDMFSGSGILLTVSYNKHTTRTLTPKQWSGIQPSFILLFIMLFNCDMSKCPLRKDLLNHFSETNQMSWIHNKYKHLLNPYCTATVSAKFLHLTRGRWCGGLLHDDSGLFGLLSRNKEVSTSLESLCNSEWKGWSLVQHMQWCKWISVRSQC